MSVKRTPDEVTISPRDINFDVAAARKGYWMDGDPVATAIMNSLSLTFPDGERMFIDAVKAYKSQVSEKLQKDVQDFIRQEAIHSREHHMLNELIDHEKYPVEEIEQIVRDRIKIGRDNGPMAMLVATICLEHLTAMMADLMVDREDMYDNTDPAIEQLWRWHAMEETEHKAVAYDVFLEVTQDWSPFKRWTRRCISMAIIGRNFVKNIETFSVMMLQADGWDEKSARKAVKRYLWKSPNLFGKKPGLFFSWFKPGFHPWDHDNRPLMAEWKAEFDAVAAE